MSENEITIKFGQHEQRECTRFQRYPTVSTLASQCNFQNNFWHAKLDTVGHLWNNWQTSITLYWNTYICIIHMFASCKHFLQLFWFPKTCMFTSIGDYIAPTCGGACPLMDWRSVWCVCSLPLDTLEQTISAPFGYKEDGWMDGTLWNPSYTCICKQCVICVDWPIRWLGFWLGSQ